ncbi:MAG: hypothetical protein ACI9MB_001199 [Verrucomicrobiales bacterium]|jgi:hypothetical protein
MKTPLTLHRLFGVSAFVIGLTTFAASAQAASLEVDFQATIASEQHPDFGGEARFYHVSMNPNNPGVGSFAATIVGTNDPGPSFVRNFTEEVVSYKWIGGTNNDISGVSVSGGAADLITYATEDDTFDGFAQNQLKLWDATDPGVDLATEGADPFNAVADVNGNGYRSFGGAVTTVDISSLSTGSVYVLYGAFNSTPTVSAVMRDTDGLAPDITITDAHLNADFANRTEYYVAQLKFVNNAGYDEIEYTHLANGSDFTGNGRGLGTVLTGSDGPPVLFAITAIEYSPDTNEVTLTWRNTGAASYTVRVSRDMTNWESDLDDGVAPDEGDTTTGTFSLTGNTAADLFFRIEED